MTRYQVDLRYVVTKTVEIDADSEREAIEMADEAFDWGSLDRVDIELEEDHDAYQLDL